MEDAERKVLIAQLWMMPDEEIPKFHSEIIDPLTPKTLYRYRELGCDANGGRNILTINGEWFSSIEKNQHVIWLTDPKCFDQPQNERDTQISFCDDTIQKYVLLQIYRKELLELHGYDRVDSIINMMLHQNMSEDIKFLEYILFISRRSDSNTSDISEYFRNLSLRSKDKIQYCKEKNRKRMTNGLAVACFSEIKDSEYMWEHYANRENGFCLEYDMTKFRKKDVLRREMFPVHYMDERVILDSLLQSNHPKNVWSSQILIAILTKKKMKYRDEKEWGFVLGNTAYDSNKSGLTFPFIKPTNHLPWSCHFLRK